MGGKQGRWWYGCRVEGNDDGPGLMMMMMMMMMGERRGMMQGVAILAGGGDCPGSMMVAFAAAGVPA